MQLNPSEISDLLKARISNFDAGAESRNTGVIVSLLTIPSCFIRR